MNFVEELDYAAIPEGPVRLGIIPAVDPNATILYINAYCTHYEWYGRTQARFTVSGPDQESDDLYYLDLTNYVVTRWSTE